MTIRKLYIDSRMASGSGSDSTLTLKQSVQCPPDTVAFLDEVMIANTFPTIGPSNRYIYLQETVGGLTHKSIATLAEGNFNLVDLATNLKEALHVAKNAGMTANYMVTGDVPTNTLSITNLTANSSFQIMDKATLLALGTWAGTHFIAPQEANDALGLQGNYTQTNAHPQTLTCHNMIQTMPHQNLFICFNNFGNLYQSQGPSGVTSILRRIPIDQAWGNLLHSQHSSPADYIDVSGQQLDTLSFQIRETEHRIVDTKGHHVSFPFV